MSTTASAASLIAPEKPAEAGVRVLPATRRLRITFSGLLFGVVNILVLLAGLNSEANLLLLLFGIGVGALAINAVLPVLMVRRIDVDRIMPEGVVADRPFAVTYRVHNHRKRLRAWGLTITEMPVSDRLARFPVAFIACLPPGHEQRIETVGRCPRRAHLSLTGIRVNCCFPFGLFVVSADLQSPAGLTVYPAIGRFRHDPWKTARIAQSQSSRTSRERDNPEEFIGVREYREGDNYHWIHWRRSAHTGELVVREMIPLRQTRLVVMLDPWPNEPGNPRSKRSSQQDGDLEAERIISAAATAICEGLEQGHRVGLICRSAEAVIIPPAAGNAHRQRLLRELAAIRPGARTAFDDLVGGIHWPTGWNSRCFVLSTRLQPEHERVARVVGSRAESMHAMSPGSDFFESLFDLSNQGAAGRRAR
jgi:uncharacterized protein (DUF58 family)